MKANSDAGGHYLDRGKSYRLQLPPNIPAKRFWSLPCSPGGQRSELGKNYSWKRMVDHVKSL
jgi:hypothetical protein